MVDLSLGSQTCLSDVTQRTMIEPLYSTNTVILECRISVRQLYYWELIGLVKPHYESFGSRKFRRYTYSDLNLLKRIKSSLDQGFTLQAVKQQIHQDSPQLEPDSIIDHTLDSENSRGSLR
jgi:DNA-binding transcriptional MerR regulator